MEGYAIKPVKDASILIMLLKKLSPVLEIFKDSDSIFRIQPFEIKVHNQGQPNLSLAIKDSLPTINFTFLL